MFKREKSKKGCKQTGVATIKANKEVHENAKAKQQQRYYICRGYWKTKLDKDKSDM